MYSTTRNGAQSHRIHISGDSPRIPRPEKLTPLIVLLRLIEFHVFNCFLQRNENNISIPFPKFLAKNKYLETHTLAAISIKI